MIDLASFPRRTYLLSPTKIYTTINWKSVLTSPEISMSAFRKISRVALHSWYNWLSICWNTILSSDHLPKNAYRTPSSTKFVCQCLSVMHQNKSASISMSCCLLTMTPAALRGLTRAQKWRRKWSSISRSKSWKRFSSCGHSTKESEMRNDCDESDQFCNFFQLFFVWQFMS